MGFYVLKAVLSAIGAALATPYPWIVLGLIAGGYAIYHLRFAQPEQGESGGRRPLVVLAAVVAVACLLGLILYAIVEVVSLPGFWITLGIAGLGYASYRVARSIQRERLEARFLDAIVALHTSDPRADNLLEALEHRAQDEADVMLLVAAGAASRARYEDVLATLDRVAGLAPSIGRLSSGLTLSFPGVAGPLSFRPDGWGASSLAVALAQLRVLAGRPREAIDAIKLTTSDPSYPLGMCTLADAHIALGEVEQAAMALREAADAPSCDPALSHRVRYRLARLLEDQGSRSAAVREYAVLVAQKGDEDASERIEALQVEAEQERRREEEARRAQEEAQRRETLTNAVAYAEELRASGHHRLAVTELRRALELPMDAEAANALRYKLAINLEDAGMPAQAAQEYEALGDYLDALARRQAIRAEEEARRQAIRAEEEARRQAIRAEEEARRQRALRAQQEEVLHQALAKLEAAKGPAGRRSAVRSGLERLSIQELRDQLLLEASRIEVEAVLDKVDGLKTAAAKRRHLLAALEALRADEVPDELQVQQIRWLEEALAALEK